MPPVSLSMNLQAYPDKAARLTDTRPLHPPMRAHERSSLHAAAAFSPDEVRDSEGELLIQRIEPREVVLTSLDRIRSKRPTLRMRIITPPRTS
jgi:hypothetical protein